MTPQIEGFHFIHLDAVDSTNNFAANWIREDNRGLPAVIMADYQTSGRGQRGNIWESASGDNLTCSLIIRPDLNAHELFKLNMRITLAIALALEDVLPGLPVQIKWPNDILIRRKKVGGILIENVLKGDTIDRSIIGFGVNVNQRQFTPEFATSVIREGSKETPVRRLLERILRYWNEGDMVSDSLQSAFFPRLLGYKSEEIYDVNGQRLRARIENIAPDGTLHMTDSAGRNLTFREKELSWIRTE